MLAIELSKREAEADAKKRELKESNSVTKTEQMNVKDLVNKSDDDFKPNKNKIATIENKSGNFGDKSIQYSNKKSERTQKQEVTPTSDAIEVLKDKMVSSKSTKSHEKTIESESEEESSFDDDEEDLSDEDFKKRKDKLTVTVNKKNDTKANLNKNFESNNATLLSKNDTCEQNSKLEKPSNKENSTQKLESNCSILNKTLPEYNSINSMKPTKRNERSLVEFAGRPISNCPLGRIELKTHSSVLRLGLSRNSRPKPLHPNAKPTIN